MDGGFHELLSFGRDFHELLSFGRRALDTHDASLGISFETDANRCRRRQSSARSTATAILRITAEAKKRLAAVSTVVEGVEPHPFREASDDRLVAVYIS